MCPAPVGWPSGDGVKGQQGALLDTAAAHTPPADGYLNFKAFARLLGFKHLYRAYNYTRPMRGVL